MAIDGIGGPGSPHRPEGPGKTPEIRKSESTRATGRDRVDLSPEARQIVELARAAMDLPEIRPGTVEALRQALDRGTYRADPREVARAILEYEGDFPY
jgi:flagellar biosynthesis anti-sigma factor FlgM